MTTLEAGQVTAALRFLLKRIEDAAVALSVDLPERRYVTVGGAVWDCAQVTVSGNTAAIGLAGDLGDVGGLPQLGPCPPGWNITVEIAIVRDANELPAGTRGHAAPKTTDIEADTERADTDAAILVQALEAAAGGGTDELGNIPASIQFGEVAGGLTAVVVTSTVNLWAIPPEP